MIVAAPSIAFQAVSKTFTGSSLPAVDGITIAIPSKQFVAIVGMSGSGKTTLLKMTNRLILPDQGSVMINGTDTATLPETSLRRKIGYVFQGVGLFPHYSVGANIAITLRLLKWDAGKIAVRIEELLELVSLPKSYAHRLPSALSGGQRQRVGVARALAAEPPHLLMDEPFGALDPITRDELARATRNLHDRLGLTTLMVTHDMSEALLMADRVVVMEQGKIIADASPHELLQGHDNPSVQALISTPQRHSERLRMLAETP